MKVVPALVRLGGAADAATLFHLSSRKQVRTAVERGTVLRISRGWYALPSADPNRHAARELAGVASHLSAAASYGWELKTPPAVPWVTVPPKRRVPADRRTGKVVCWRNLAPAAYQDGVTTRLQTVLDCARDLPFDEALAVADSALREGQLSKEELLDAARSSPSRGRQRALRVADAADERAYNPFESVLRAHALTAGGLDLRPQVEIATHGLQCTPDLVDLERRIIVEAESFRWHGDRRALRRDCRRYTLLALGGWTVIRFSWEDVILQPAYVEACLRELGRGHPDRRWSRRRPPEAA